PTGLLELYGRAHAGKRVADDETNPSAIVLRLSGIARVENGYLIVRNRIYRRAFGKQWIAANMPDAELMRQRAAFRRGIILAATVAAAILAVITVLAVGLIKQRNRAEEQQARAEREKSEKSRLLYASQIALAYQAWEKGNVGLAAQLLDHQLPEP